ncbi:hypothetical protein GCM10011375_37750 [Hymenobacter qilianensis]|uniref:Uncharacterized protein n=1 Tax=Hymenobacter qilianensis TaxID=1385715 RepID=A0ACB5PWP5_9BACT|nr:hypothetical protein GCM10011375_37750 [Hymenobacter qilianensis]
MALSLAPTPNGFSQVQALALDESGNVYLAGSFAGTIMVGATTLTSAGEEDVLVAKWNSATSSFSWVQRAGGEYGDRAMALAVRGAEVYVTGYFGFLDFPVGTSTARFGPVALTSAGGGDIFVAKLTEAGNSSSFTWAEQAGGPTDDWALALALGESAVYVTGSFEGSTARFGSSSLSSAGASDVFVTKLTDSGPSGRVAWVQQVGGPGSDIAQALAVRGSTVYIGGGFTSTPARFGTSSLSSAGFSDVFVTKLTDEGPSGRFMWVQQAGGESFDASTALAVQGGTVYVAGVIGGPADFGPIPLLSPPNTGTGFLATLPDGLPLATADADPGAEALSLYPNPAQGSTTVRLPPSRSPTTLTLLDARGRVVWTRTVAPSAKAHATGLDLHSLAPGIYAVQIQTTGIRAVRRLARH